MKKWITTKEARQMFGISRDKVQRLASSGAIASEIYQSFHVTPFGGKLVRRTLYVKSDDLGLVLSLGTYSKRAEMYDLHQDGCSLEWLSEHFGIKKESVRRALQRERNTRTASAKR